ncbi:hypothetical protein ACFP2T_37630 [Plantactinospora solaniradicis]|uniref:Uncharacterized protein n=1 Tax=Plantactinospora solaniradicis TaxID=1723736 RepID=A0ABW1KKQ8_9ACTN
MSNDLIPNTEGGAFGIAGGNASTVKIYVGSTLQYLLFRWHRLNGLVPGACPLITGSAHFGQRDIHPRTVGLCGLKVEGYDGMRVGFSVIPLCRGLSLQYYFGRPGSIDGDGNAMWWLAGELPINRASFAVLCQDALGNCLCGRLNGER